MKGDFTRSTFKPRKHYSSVRMQQGRVQLDADWNEQIDIAAHRGESETGHVVGAYAVPLLDPGFGITVDTTDGDVLRIGKGHLYLDGILVENEETVPITGQIEFLPGYTLPSAMGDYVAYLDVWQRHVTALEDDGIREVALGGPDTATRTQTAWQVRLLGPLTLEESLTCSSDLSETAWEQLVNYVPGKLRAHTASGTTTMPTNLCEVPAGAGYRRLENQLYRVEIHTPGPRGTATFKWSRDNGSIATSWTGQDGNDLFVSSLGRDQVLGFAAGQTVELTSDDCELYPEKYPSVLVKLNKAEGQVLTIESSAPDRSTFGRNPKIRRWDCDGEVQTSGSWIALEDGVEVHFESGCDYRTGDYWMIPARTSRSGIEWPVDATDPSLAAAVERQGIEHHYCRLATLSSDGTTFTVTGDCRPKFPPLSMMTGLYYVGGDGQEAMPANELPQALEVRVACGGWVIEGATVQFTAEGNGQLAESQGATSMSTLHTLDVDSGPDGIARCYWRPEAVLSNPSQQVVARLMDADGNPVKNEAGDLVHEIHFTANLSIAAQVAYESGTCLLTANTVKEALDQLCGNITLYYVSGDGQEAMPGGWLRQPLQVRVANGDFPAPGAWVYFRIVEGDGNLAELKEVKCSELEKLPGFPEEGLITEIFLETDENGMASCCWTLGEADLSQRVEAGIKGEPALVYFNASLSVAREVAYEPGSCLAEATTVSDALDQLCEKVTELSNRIEVAYVSGDGQEAMPDRWLQRPLQVQVTRGGSPLRNAQITFQVTEGTGELAEEPPEGRDSAVLEETRDLSAGFPGQEPGFIVIETDLLGLASCYWKLDGANASQRVSATLGGLDELPGPLNDSLRKLGDEEPPTRRELAGEKLPSVYFNANLSVADQVYYRSGDCLPNAHTVQEALDQLCARPSGGTAKSCCVTVGVDGDYPTLENALEQLLSKQATQINICLLQDEQITMAAFANDPSVITAPTHVSIKGAAQSVVAMQGPLKLNGLSSFKMRDVHLVIPEFGDEVGFITFEGCEQVVLENCVIEGNSEAGSLLRINTASQVIFRDNAFRLENQLGLETFKALVSGTPFEAYARAGDISTRTRNSVNKKYTAMTIAQREALANKIVEQLQSGEITVSQAQMPSYLAFTDALKVTSDDFSLVDEVLDDIHVNAVATAGVAILFDDAEADVVMQNNHVAGGISLYGAPDKVYTADQLLSEIAQIKEWWKEAPLLSASERSFHLNGNHLDQICLSQRMAQALLEIAGKGGRLAGLYAECFASENVFEAEASYIFASSVGFHSNHSAIEEPDAIQAVILADVAAFTGNRAIQPNKILHYAGDIGVAANVRMLVEPI